MESQLQALAAMTRAAANTKRELELKNRKADMLIGSQMKGDFDKAVTGEWYKLNEDGTGTVIYNDRKYQTVPRIEYSIRKGQKVQLSYEKGVYYSRL